MNRISFTEDATQDIEEIYEYIAQDNIAAADRHMDRLQKRWLALVEQPRIGSKRDEIEPGLRSVAEGNYVIFYRISNSGVQVVRVLQGSRDSKRILRETEK